MSPREVLFFCLGFVVACFLLGGSAECSEFDRAYGAEPPIPAVDSGGSGHNLQPVKPLPSVFLARHSITVHDLARDGTPDSDSSASIDVAKPEPSKRTNEEPVAPLSIPEIVCSFPWPCGEALAVMACESGGDPGAVSAAGAVGLFQIHPYNAANFDPATNIAAAWRKYLYGVSIGNPWHEWNAYGSCGWF